MASVPAGSRLRIQGGQASLIVRSLRPVDLEGSWQVPVLGDVSAWQAAGLTTRTAVVEFPTDQGPVRVEAELVGTEGGYLLRALRLRTAAFTEQRRENVRGLLELPLRGAVLIGAPSGSRARGGLEPDERDADLTGTTRSVSAGGISADLQAAARGMRTGARVYVELGMPDGDLAPAVLSVLEEGARFRARFIDISPLDRERLVRMVFARHRVELSQRGRS